MTPKNEQNTKTAANLQIIIKKKLNDFYAGAGSRILIGDIRGPMALSTVHQCERLIDSHYGKLDKMWILIHSYPEPADRFIIRTKIVLLKEQPPKMLGSVCFLVDYTISDVDLLWALPLDTARPAGIESDEGASRIIEDAGGMPIIH